MAFWVSSYPVINWGQVSFENAVGDRKQGGGNPEKYVLLNESQTINFFSDSRYLDFLLHCPGGNIGLLCCVVGERRL